MLASRELIALHLCAMAVARAAMLLGALCATQSAVALRPWSVGAFARGSQLASSPMAMGDMGGEELPVFPVFDPRSDALPFPIPFDNSLTNYQFSSATHASRSRSISSSVLLS